MQSSLKTLPQKPSALWSPGMFAGVVLGATAAGGLAMVYLLNPSTHGFYPICLFHALTGWNCPGCGATRALYALLHGNVRVAMKDNALFVLALAALAVWGGRLCVRKWRQQPANAGLAPQALWFWLAASLVFGVVRNLPGFSWLSP